MSISRYFLGVYFLFSTNQVIAKELSCAVQMVRADAQFLQKRPVDKFASTLKMNETRGGGFITSFNFEFSQVLEEAQSAVKVEVTGYFQPQKSRWATFDQELGRLELSIRVYNSQGTLIGAMVRDSDEIYTPNMLARLKSGELQVIAKVQLPTLWQKLSQSRNSVVVENIKSGDIESAIHLALILEEIPGWEPQRADVICSVD